MYENEISTREFRIEQPSRVDHYKAVCDVVPTLWVFVVDMACIKYNNTCIIMGTAAVTHNIGREKLHKFITDYYYGRTVYPYEVGI